MEQRLIDANALYEQISEKEELARQRVLETPSRMPNGDFNPSAMRYATQLDERTQMKFMVVDAPTIEAEPVKHGKWIPCTSSEYWKSLCSECGCRAGYWFNEENSGIESWERDYSEWLSDYCPNCGARMDKDV